MADIPVTHRKTHEFGNPFAFDTPEQRCINRYFNSFSGRCIRHRITRCQQCTEIAFRRLQGE